MTNIDFIELTYGRIPNEHRLKLVHQISPALTALGFCAQMLM